MISLLLSLSIAHAGFTSAGTFATGGDDTYKEILGESVNAWSTCGGSTLYATTAEVDAFIAAMAPTGYTNYRHYSDSLAWSSDFEQAKYDALYADAADIFYLSTHGSSGAAYFCGSSGDNVLTAAETKWGDGDLEVGIFSSCNTLDSAGRTAFGAANLNAGVHYLMGFDSFALDTSTTGDAYGKQLAANNYIDSGWWAAVDLGHGPGYMSADVRFTSSACNTWYDKANSMSCDPKSGSSAVFLTYATY